MGIVEELQHVAAQQASSPEGFQQVIQLVLDAVERGGTSLSPRHLLVHEYVTLMQQSRKIKEQLSELSELSGGLPFKKGDPMQRQYATLQKQLSDTIHLAKRKARELPSHVLLLLRSRFDL